MSGEAFLSGETDKQQFLHNLKGHQLQILTVFLKIYSILWCLWRYWSVLINKNWKKNIREDCFCFYSFSGTDSVKMLFGSIFIKKNMYASFLEIDYVPNFFCYFHFQNPREDIKQHPWKLIFRINRIKTFLVKTLLKFFEG